MSDDSDLQLPREKFTVHSMENKKNLTADYINKKSITFVLDFDNRPNVIIN
jgi:hypothetical protein